MIVKKMPILQGFPDFETVQNLVEILVLVSSSWKGGKIA